MRTRSRGIAFARGRRARWYRYLVVMVPDEPHRWYQYLVVVPLHFEEGERAPSANAQREGNFEVNRTDPFYCVVSQVLESGECLHATEPGEGNS